MSNEINEKLMNSLKESISNNLGEYVGLEPLSRGSDGYVFRMRDRKNQKEYALKVIYKDKTKKGTDAKIKNEINIHQSLRSQFIIQLLTKFQDPDNYYIVVEYCSKGDLANYMRSSGFIEGMPLTQLRPLAQQIAKGVNYLHDNLVVHRDLKPENILITADRRAKICDFGYSARTAEKMSDIVGTLNCLAPEIVVQGKYDSKIDVWAYGCILYTMAVGETPFKFKKPSDVVHIKGEQLKYPESLDSNLVDLLKKIFVNNPAERLDIKQILCHKFFCDESPQLFRRASSSKLLPTMKTQQKDEKLTARVSVNLNSKHQSQKENFDVNRPPSEGNKRKSSPIETKLTARNCMRLHNKKQPSKELSNDIRLKVQENPLTLNATLSPVKSRGLRPASIDTQHGLIKIDANGFTNETKEVRFNVSPDGSTIRISKNSQEKTYTLPHLPPKYQGRYKYCKEVIRILKNNSPKVKLENQRGKFSLMWNGRFVADLTTGKIELMSCSPDKPTDSEERLTAKRYYRILSDLIE